MIYVTIDTNVYLDILLNPNEYDYNLKEKNYGEIIEDMKEEVSEDIYRYRENKLPLSLIPLKTLCDNNVIKLIITEVTKLELMKQNARCIDDINKGYKQLETTIKNEKMWNNISYIKNELQSVLKQNKRMNIENWTYGYEKLMEFLESENNINLELNANVVCNLYRKNIAGLLGDNEKEVENATKNNDYLFVNTVQEYFKNNINENDHIFLITKDNKDFRGSRITDNEDRMYYELKDNFKDKNTDIKILADMKSFYKWTNVEVDLRKIINDKIDIIFEERKNDCEYTEDSMWHNCIYWYNENIKEDIINDFNMKNKSLKEINLIRERTLTNITNLLKECRELSSWDNRSEIKLYSWLEENEESELIILNLSTLLKIKENLLEYKKIHLDMMERV
ncbi:hypothetical protein [Clostridium butyricum]|uniref:hypothetical protein n=1 Tax=Clostridium butyricum TaxID=1492 RepID=UPI0018A93700|nr:hypothetical protein [Clostridium butyricum]MDB2157217.1 hypothetical protein [Clostridium butyricum]